MRIDLLNLPFFYNLRFFLAGDQKLTREFILDNYQKYKCHSVLDVGCGTGDFAPLFPKKEYLGADINPRYIEFAKKKYGCNFICKDVVEYNFDDRLFDTSLFVSVLHHLDDHRVRKIMSKIISITRKIIVVIDLNPKTSLIKKILIDLDRGKCVRTTEEKISLLSPFAKIDKVSHFSTGLASQTGMVLLPYEKKYN